ncbi:hypothetical protein EIP86_009289 [Pleurotus ostreatoroseus]|nr:hypothetical protein EIP86_009289 [Pleurotus ostreatoroseus]
MNLLFKSANIEAAHEDAASTNRAAALQALQEQDRVLNAQLNHHNKEILRIRGAKRSLRTQFNALAAISRLPTEVLSLVFQAYVDNYWVAENHNSQYTVGVRAQIYTTSMCGWLVLLQVCQHWRSVALGTPSLWTRIELGCQPYVDLALKHSGDMPLEVFAGRHRSEPNSPYEFEILTRSLLPVFSRLRIAQFRFSDPNLKSALFILRRRELELQAPILEKLTLLMNGRSRPHTLTRIPTFPTMELPHLTDLTIENASSTLLASFIRPTLTNLNVTFFPALTPSALVQVLEQLPLLRCLKLSGFKEAGRTPVSAGLYSPPWCRRIPLPHLKLVWFESRLHALEVAHLLGCLDFPEYTQIRFLSIRDEALSLQTRDIERVLSLLMSKALVSQADRMATPRVIKITSAYAPSLNVVLWSALRPSDMGSAVTPAAKVPRLELAIATTKHEALPHFFTLLNVSKAIVLDIEDEATDTEEWISIFRHRALPMLRDLILTGLTAITEFMPVITAAPDTSLQALSAINSTHDGDHAHSFLFPTLKTLTLRFCVFRLKPRKTLRYDALPLIVKMLRTRSKHGYKVEKLIIHHPINLTREEDLAALRDPRIADVVEIGPGEEEPWSSSEDDEEVDESDFELKA